MWHIRRCVLAGVLAVASSASPAQNQSATLLDDAIHQCELLSKQPAGAQDGVNWLRLATLYQLADRYHRAEHAYDRAIRLLGTHDLPAAAAATDRLGSLYAQEGKLKKAEEIELSALQIREATRDLLGVGLIWMNLAMISLGQHHLGDASMYAEWAVDRLVPAANPQNSEVTIDQQMTALIYFAEVRSAQGDSHAAILALHRARQAGEAKYPPSSFPMAYVDFLLGYTQWKSGNVELAAPLMKTGLEGIQPVLGWGHPTYLKLMKQYADFLNQTGRRAEAAMVRKEMARVSETGRAGMTGQTSAMLAFAP